MRSDMSSMSLSFASSPFPSPISMSRLLSSTNRFNRVTSSLSISSISYLSTWPPLIFHPASPSVASLSRSSFSLCSSRLASSSSLRFRSSICISKYGLTTSCFFISLSLVSLSLLSSCLALLTSSSLFFLASDRSFSAFSLLISFDSRSYLTRLRSEKQWRISGRMHSLRRWSLSSGWTCIISWIVD